MRPNKFTIDLYAKGSTVVEVDDKGDIIEIVAWAGNSLVARAAFDRLCSYKPNNSFQQWRKSWVEAERRVKR